MPIIIKSLLKIIPSSLTNRLANRYTTGGGLILLMVVEQAGILPQGATKALEGIPNIEYWVLTAVALWLLLEKSPKAISFFYKSKQQELEEMIIKTKILEEELKQKGLQKELESNNKQ